MAIFTGNQLYRIFFLKSCRPKDCSEEHLWMAPSASQVKLGTNEEIHIIIQHNYVRLIDYWCIWSLLSHDAECYMAKCFMIFSYFANLHHEHLGAWNNSKIWETRLTCHNWFIISTHSFSIQPFQEENYV